MIEARLIAAWRLSAVDAPGFLKLGSFNWPPVVLALIDEIERLQRDLDEAVGYRLATQQETKGDQDVER